METKHILIAIVVVASILSIPLLIGGAHPAVGTWAYTVETPAGPIAQTLTLNADMTGTISVTEPGEATYPISNAIVDESSFSFIVESEVVGQKVSFSFHGTVDGDVMTGEYVSVFGTTKVIGERQ